MSSPPLVVDNTVLSAFDTAGWFETLQFWNGRYRITVTERIWEQEFLLHHDYSAPPPWLTVRAVSLGSIEGRLVGRLSEQDWSAIALAMQDVDSLLLTNDRAMRDEARQRDIDVEWGTKFALRTFEDCGIGLEQFDNGVEPYASDVRLPDDVTQELRNAEKD